MLCPVCDTVVNNQPDNDGDIRCLVCEKWFPHDWQEETVEEKEKKKKRR